MNMYCIIVGGICILKSLKRLENCQDLFLKTETKTKTVALRLRLRPRPLPKDQDLDQDSCLKRQTIKIWSSGPDHDFRNWSRD